jgi:hypothetical protein
MVTSSIGGSSATFRASGIGRYFGAAFLTVWLAGWAMGEAFALGFLVMLIRSVVGSAVGQPWPIPGGDWIAGGAAGVAFLFLVSWLTLWTFGGVAAIHELLRSLAGEDSVVVRYGGVELVRRAGPFRRSRTFERSLIRRVRTRRHDDAVVIDTATGTEVITKYGTPAERQRVIEWLRQQLSLPEDSARDAPAPPGWTVTVEGGMTRLSQLDARSRRTGALIVWVIAGFTGLIWYGSIANREVASSAIACLFTLLLASAAAWVTWSRREWLIRQGQLTSHRRFAAWQWERSFQSARLEVVESTDSDNDRHYKLHVIDAEGKRTIASTVHDEAEVVDLARWLAARTGFPLTLPHGLRLRPR